VKTPAAAVYQFGPFTVDTGLGELRKHRNRVSLQEQPLSLLVILVEHAGSVVTKAEIQNRIWDEHTFVDFDASLRVAVGKLRAALGDTAANPRYIETIAGRGYRFIAPVTDVGILQEKRQLQSAHVLRSSLLPPSNKSFLPNHFAISPDGRRLAFIATNSDSNESIWIRDLSSSRMTQLEGTNRARTPFWSPDSRHLGFFSFGKLNTIDLVDGEIRTICESNAYHGAAWHTSDVIVFAPSVTGPLCRVSAFGGTPAAVTPRPSEHSSQLHCWPVFVTGSDDFLFFVNRVAPQDTLRNGLYATSLNSGEVTLVSPEIEGNVACALGYVFYRQKGSLIAQRYDKYSRRLIDVPLTIAQHELKVWEQAWFHSSFSVSQTGLLVFHSTRDFYSELQWFDGAGNSLGRLPLRGCQDPAISPDGKLLAFCSDEFNDGRLSIGIYDFERDVTSRLTEGPNDWHPSWSRGGSSVIYDRLDGYVSSSWKTNADCSDAPRRILPLGSALPHESVSGDLAFMQIHQTGPMICVWSPGQEEPLKLAPGAEPQFSPDGRWIAYAGPPPSLGIEIKPFPGPGPRIQISNVPAAQPRWSADGKQLFFVTSDRKIATASFDSFSGRVGAPHPLFETCIVGSSFVGFQYDVSIDGRFLINSLPSSSSPLTLITGWHSVPA
jgi:DNA-binding winged helix-turn-helix (wHTH) protein/Tol biopolymer transport system component